MNKIKNQLKIWSHSRRFYIGVSLFILMFGLDIATKWIIQSCLTYQQEIYLIPNFLYVTLTYNTGGIFGIGNGTIGARIAFIVIRVGLAILIPIIYMLKGRKIKDRYKVVLLLIYAGCIGNVIDGIFYWGQNGGPNGVIDWIGFIFGSWRFAVFNVADSYVTIAVILAIIYLAIDEVKEYKINKAKGMYDLPPEEYERKLKELEEQSKTSKVEDKEEKQAEKNE